MSKIRVIDLLNKIANGEIRKGQRFIIHFKEGLTRDIFYRGWESEKTSISSLRYYSDNNVVQDEYDLNDTVEIIEEESEIDIQGIEEMSIYTDSYDLTLSEVNTEKTKINQLIKAVKQLDNQINNK